jgi:hypothetical protein
MKMDKNTNTNVATLLLTYGNGSLFLYELQYTVHASSDGTVGRSQGTRFLCTENT